MGFVSQNIQTTYATILPVQSSIDEKYSFEMIEYLNKNNTCDIALSNYTLIDKYNDQKSEEIYNKNQMFFESDFEKNTLENYGIVWRTNIHSFLGEIKLENNNYIFCDWLKNNLNMFCISNESLYFIYKYFTLKFTVVLLCNNP